MGEHKHPEPETEYNEYAHEGENREHEHEHEHSHESHHHHDEDSGHDHHHHDHGEDCGCGHDHDHGHSHEHHHDHGEDCGCGHDHDHGHGHEHHHDHGEDCGCGHDHGHDHDHEEAAPCTSDAPLRVYMIHNLDCANCAAKVESKLKTLPGVEYVSITFATKQLRVASYDHEKLLPLMEKTIDEAEPGVTITLRDAHSGKHAEAESDSPKDLICIIVGILFFLAGILTEKFGGSLPSFLPLVFYALSYLVLGLEIVLTAIKNLFKGKVLDENFLMSIATLGAFGIGEYPEAVGVMLFYRIGEWFEDMAVNRSRSQIMDALDMRPETVLLASGEDSKEIPAADAAVGDIILVRPGDRIPLDGTVCEGESKIDTAPITGEPVPIIARKDTFLYSGCVNISGVLHMKVEKPLSESMVTRILDSVENAAAGKPSIDRFITRFSKIYTPFVVIFAILIAVIPSLITGQYTKWLYTALTFLVISCPCALVLSVPLAFFAGIGAGSKKGILFKSGLSLEMLNNVKTVVMDKTGTLTKGNFAVQKILPARQDVTDAAKTAGAPSEKELLRIAASCEKSSTHPIALSILEEADKQGITDYIEGQIEEISGHGIVLKAGADTYLCGNKKLLALHHTDLAEDQIPSYGSEILLAKNGAYIGCLIISDTLKEDAKSAVALLRKRKLHTAMLTGDTEENAMEVAGIVGIDTVCARLLPEEKLEKLKEIREKFGSVLFIGDGINDAVVLAGADVGAAMGSGADAAMEAADVVFMHSDLSSVPAAYALSRLACRISRQNVVFAIAVKVLVMLLGVLGFASMWLAVLADTGVAILCILNSVRILHQK